MGLLKPVQDYYASENGERQAKIERDRKKFRVDVGALCAAIVAGLIAFGTFWATTEATRVANRAYLSVGDIVPNQSGPDGFVIHFRNFGHVPAVPRSITLTIERRDDQGKRIGDAITRRQTLSGIINPGDASSFVSVVVLPSLSAPDKAAMNSGKQAFFIHGWLRFDDGFHCQDNVSINFSNAGGTWSRRDEGSPVDFR